MQNIHPILVHFPIALTLSAVVFDLVGLWRKKEQWHMAAKWNMLTAFAISLATLASGLYAERGVPHSGDSHELMIVHKRLAIGFVVLLGIVSLWRWRCKVPFPEAGRKIYILLICSAAILIGITAHWGGRLVYEHGIGTAVVYSENQNKGHANGHDHSKAGDSETTAPRYKELMSAGKCLVMPEEDVDPEINYEYQGVVYQFCCKKCRSKFKSDPEMYLQ